MANPRRASIRRLPLLLMTIAALLVATGVAVLATSGGSGGARGGIAPFSAVDMRGNRVTLDPGAGPAPAARAVPVADTGGRLVVPSVHLDVPLGAINAVDGQVTPPGFTSAYWVRNKGVPLTRTTKGTVYVVMHAVRLGGLAPGNFLTDVASGTATVRRGAEVSVDNVRYEVTGAQRYLKGQLSSVASLWADTPRRLLLITCLEHADGSPSSDNLVVTAIRA